MARDAKVEARRQLAKEEDTEVEGEVGVDGGVLDLVEREAWRVPSLGLQLGTLLIYGGRLDDAVALALDPVLRGSGALVVGILHHDGHIQTRIMVAPCRGGA